MRFIQHWPKPFWSTAEHRWLVSTKTCDTSYDREMPVERVPKGHRPYNWAVRREGVMRRFKRVKNWVLPIGFAETWFFEPLDSMLPVISRMEDPRKAATMLFWHRLIQMYSRELELAWLMQTQDQDIAPESAILAANGLEAASRHANEKGIGDDVEESVMSTAIADTISGQRAERFAMEVDYATWHTTPPRKLHGGTVDGKRTLKPAVGSEWTREEMLEILRRPIKPFNPEPWDEFRLEFEEEDQVGRYREERGVDYAGSEPCPASQFTYAGYKMCDNGKAPVFGSIKNKRTKVLTVEKVDTGDCNFCNGSGKVPTSLGLDLPAVEIVPS